ncbi:LexA family protein [Chitinophaga ginsengisegetis]|uniref:LexA family protein n=1 Tax=Chitinophaga ginsengisegetis TaxID=393003 RepID=UPI000DBF7CBB|nr:translesion error-prone DNA polymerase V autoproteolytic subunit [Chitinophaga ginsengisegetis]MDR6565475.1 DNA polymerase V [Chitinophaga ginsengisegetis]MDR6645203.1 DNA polymerase V [Chitinophaga ginsengisegetis]MDR6652205.1 DNA polymerase V [Chitinophaga ginsengisegetis]
MIAMKLATSGLVMPFFTATIPAGFPSPAQDYSEEEIDLSKILQPNPTTTFIIRVKGNSMEQANMPDGCLVVVDRSQKAQSGSIVVAILDGEFTIKRLVKAGRNWVLHPENPFYKPIVIQEDADFQVWGVVTNIVISTK